MTLNQLNELTAIERTTALASCCGATAWVERMNTQFPFASMEDLLAAAATTWFSCSPQDWLEAFTHHPKIGDLKALEEKYAATRSLAAAEQAAVQQSGDEVLSALAAGNLAYENKFGYIFIVSATGKSAAAMLDLLNARLMNPAEAEIHIAAQEQSKITVLRLQKLITK